MSVLIQRPRPFCNRAVIPKNTTPIQGYGGGTIRRGFLWDGSTYPFGNSFGAGSEHPIGLSLEQMSRWFYRLDQWQITGNFDTGYMINGTPDPGTFGSHFIDYGEFPDGGAADPSVAMRSRIFGRLVDFSSRKVSSDFFGETFSMRLTMDIGDVLLADSASPKLYYPAIRFSASPDFDAEIASRIFGNAGVSTVRSNYRGNPAWPATDSGVDFVLNDGVDDFNLRIWNDDASNYPVGFFSSVPTVLCTAAAAKPTGYLTD